MARLYSTNFYSRPETGFAPSVAPSGAAGTFAAFGDVGLSGLKQSLPYKQADWRGRQRMEKMVGMGLPFNTDPSRVRAEPALTSAMGGRPIYSTSMPQPWGTWSGFGQKEEDRPVRLKEQIGIGPQPEKKPAQQPTPQPARTPRTTGYIKSRSGTGFSRTQMGFNGEPASFTSGGQYFGMAPKPTPTSTPIPFPELNTRNYFSSTMGGIKFPYANY